MSGCSHPSIGNLTAAELADATELRLAFLAYDQVTRFARVPNRFPRRRADARSVTNGEV